MESALGSKLPGPKGRGGFINGGEAVFIAETSLHVAPDRGGERGWKNGGVKTRSRPLQLLGRVHLCDAGNRGRRVHLCTRLCWRGYLWCTQEEVDARMP